MRTQQQVLPHFPGMILSEERAQGYLRDGLWQQDTMLDALIHDTWHYPNLVHRDELRTLTYQQLWDETEAVAATLYDMGVRGGDKVAIQLPTTLDYVVALFGAVKLGAVGVLIQVDLGREAVAASLKMSGCSVLITAQSYRGQTLAENAISLRAELPALREVIVQGGKPDDLPLGASSFEEIRSAGRRLSDEIHAAVSPRSLDLFVMAFTSGTTGSPKSVVHLHANYLFALRGYAEAYGHKPGEATLCMAPISHQTGMLGGIGLPIITGGRMLLMERFAVSRVLQWMEEEKPSYLVGAPPHVIHIANAPNLEDIDTTNARLFIYAGGPVSGPLLRHLQETSGITVSCMFGWTEGLGVTITRPDDPIDAISRTVGRELSGIELRLVDENGQDVPRDTPGELLCRGPNFSIGYYNNPEAAHRQWDNEGWFHSGDLLRRDADGRFVFMGRADDIINRGGTKIDPKQVEDVCSEHPAIAQVVLVGVPDPVLGQRTAACVVLAEGAEPFALSELHQFLEARGLARFQRPDMLEFMAEFPSTHSGKTKRKELRAMLADHG